MQSTKRVEPLDELAEDLRAMTREENEALWRVRELDWLSPKEYIAWCSFLTRNLPASREDLATDDYLPFEL
jgi:hypothetical protein